MGVTAAITAIASAATATNAIVSSAKQSKANDKAAAAQAAQIAAAQAATDQMAAQSKVDDSAATAADLLTRKRAAASLGRGSTLLTGPSGLTPTSGNVATKTLLGQ